MEPCFQNSWHYSAPVTTNTPLITYSFHYLELISFNRDTKGRLADGQVVSYEERLWIVGTLKKNISLRVFIRPKDVRGIAGHD